MTEKDTTFDFQAETKQLLDIVIHSLYSNKDIFLRELISNASDALDRLRFEALTKAELISAEHKPEIRLEPEAESRTLTIKDNGIGMSREEVIANIGTIAKSGTRELMDRLKGSESPEAMAQLIGQFGVGFYSAFMVADRVTLITRRAGEENATRWDSTGDGTYTLRTDQRFGHGTTIILHLKKPEKDQGINDYSDIYEIRRIVKRYSDFITYPIVSKEKREEPEPGEEHKPVPKTQTVIEDKVLNSMKPLWVRPKDEVKEEDYKELYKHISHDWNEPFDHISFRAEGRIEYDVLLFIPGEAAYDIYYREQTYGLQLFVRHVAVMESCEDLLPSYLRFLKGVVDSADLPLNISRESIQQDRHIPQMKKWIVRKVLDYLKQLQANNLERYLEFWKQFGQVLKEGVRSDDDNRDRLTKLYHFASSHDPEKQTTFAEYAERMKEGQQEIYYLTGETRAVVENSPHLEAFMAKGYEVMYFVDPVDEVVAQSVVEYDDKRLKSIGKGTIELGTKEERAEEEKQLKEKSEEYKTLLEALQKPLDEWVREVRLSNRLTTSPVCLVGGEHDPSPHLERMLREMQQAEMPMGGMPMGPTKRILEINPEHPILVRLKEQFDKDAEFSKLGDYAGLLYGYARIAEGSQIPDAVKLHNLVGDLMTQGL